MEVNANMETFMERVCEKKTLDEIQYEDMFARYNCISRDAQLCLKKKNIHFLHRLVIMSRNAGYKIAI